MTKNNGILLENREKEICLVNDFGFYAIEYYGVNEGVLTLAEGDTDESRAEVIDLYNNCVNIEGYFESLINTVICEQNRKESAACINQ